jgi:hypothetical protein
VINQVDKKRRLVLIELAETGRTGRLVSFCLLQYEIRRISEAGHHQCERLLPGV